MPATAHSEIEWPADAVRASVAYQLARGESHAVAVVEATGTAWLARSVWPR